MKQTLSLYHKIECDVFKFEEKCSYLTLKLFLRSKICSKPMEAFDLREQILCINSDDCNIDSYNGKCNLINVI